jgi:hypothetical protein
LPILRFLRAPIWAENGKFIPLGLK